MRNKLLLLGVLLVSAFLMSCGSDKKVTVGSKAFSEQYIVAEMLALQLEDAGYEVDRKFGMSSFALRQALTTGQVDICVDYTGTGWTAYLKQETNIKDPEELFNKVAAMDKENGVNWSHRMGFNNTYALAVSRAFAEEHGLATLHDLAALEEDMDLTYAIEYEFFERPDGFFAMADIYDFSVEKDMVKTMDVGLTYEALNNGDVDVSMVYSTDGNLIKHDLVVLDDTEAFFPFYNLCVVTNGEFLAENSDVADLVGRISPLLDQETITNLNYQVDAEGKESDVVAEAFLKEHSLID
ncbi:MAG: glycine betaine ABC transporter substrate-binding protein [Spirochaetales bacterium]|nr:glycine betaine ABC transporter substrate-binding protein [Spirochaetales bacterium]